MLGCLRLALASAGCPAGLFWHALRRGMTPGQVERLVAESGLASGATRADVESWLASRRITQEYSEDLDSFGAWGDFLDAARSR